MTGPDHKGTTDRIRAMYKPRRQHRILLGAATRTLKVQADILESASPNPRNLQKTINLLEGNDAALYETDKYIIELPNPHEVE